MKKTRKTKDAFGFFRFLVHLKQFSVKDYSPFFFSEINQKSIDFSP